MAGSDAQGIAYSEPVSTSGHSRQPGECRCSTWRCARLRSAASAHQFEAFDMFSPPVTAGLSHGSGASEPSAKTTQTRPAPVPRKEGDLSKTLVEYLDPSPPPPVHARARTPPAPIELSEHNLSHVTNRTERLDDNLGNLYERVSMVESSLGDRIGELENDIHPVTVDIADADGEQAEVIKSDVDCVSESETEFASRCCSAHLNLSQTATCRKAW